jgi:NAD(P)-dependent dehydrogenase (short-subunit alcohol dehydrogenase family)
MKGRKIEGSVALVTGANRGIGKAIAERLLERGATKVYVGARDPKTMTSLKEKYGDRVVPLKLDVTNVAQVAEAVSAAGDLQLLFNNAGVAQGTDLTSKDIVVKARNEMEVNYFGPLNLLQQFAPTLKHNGGGSVVNVASVGGLTNFPLYPTYSASKAAIHSLTQGARMLLGAQGTQVAGVYPGPVDTDMARGIEMDKATPQDVANAILDGVEAGLEDIFPDPFAKQFGQQFQSSPKESEQQITAMVNEAQTTH